MSTVEDNIKNLEWYKRTKEWSEIKDKLEDRILELEWEIYSSYIDNEKCKPEYSEHDKTMERIMCWDEVLWYIQSDIAFLVREYMSAVIKMKKSLLFVLLGANWESRDYPKWTSRDLKRVLRNEYETLQNIVDVVIAQQNTWQEGQNSEYVDITPY